MTRIGGHISGSNNSKIPPARTQLHDNAPNPATTHKHKPASHVSAHRPQLPPLQTRFPAQSPGARLQGYADHENRNNGIMHPDMPTSPTNPPEIMTPKTQAFTHVARNQFNRNPNVPDEQIVTGQPSPGGRNMVLNQRNPIRSGDTRESRVDIKPEDTHVAHTHPEPGLDMISGKDQNTAFLQNNPPRNPPLNNSMFHPPTQSWTGFAGIMAPDGKTPQFNRLNQGYTNGPITYNAQGFPQTRIPTEVDRIHPAGNQDGSRSSVPPGSSSWGGSSAGSSGSSAYWADFQAPP